MAYRLSEKPKEGHDAGDHGHEKPKDGHAPKEGGHGHDKDVAAVEKGTKEKAKDALTKGDNKEHPEGGKHEKPKGPDKHPKPKEEHPEEQPGPDGHGEAVSIPDGRDDRSTARATGTTFLKVGGGTAAGFGILAGWGAGPAMGSTVAQNPFIANAVAGRMAQDPSILQGIVNSGLLNVEKLASGKAVYWTTEAGKQSFIAPWLGSSLIGIGGGALLGALLAGKEHRGKGALVGAGVGAVASPLLLQPLLAQASTSGIAPWILPVLGAYGGYKVGKWIETQTGLHPLIARSVGTVGGVAGGAYFAGNSALFANTIGLLPQAVTFLGPLGLAGLGALAGYGIGKKWFGNGRLGAAIGAGVGGTGALMLGGVAAGTVLAPAAFVGAAGAGVYALGRGLQNYFGWERKNILGTMFDAPKGLVHGAMNGVSWLANTFIRKPSQGFHNAMMDRPSTGLMQNVIGKPTAAVRSVVSAPFRFFDGVMNQLHLAPKNYKKDRFPKEVGEFGGNVLRAPDRGIRKGVKWLLAPRGGAGGGHDAGGHGGGH